MLALQATAYSAPAWSTFFSAQVGASAALTGLLFVAVSVNIKRVLEFPQLAALTAKALTTLVAVLVVSTLCLVPGQSGRVLGAELVAVGAVVVLAILRMLRMATRNNLYIRRWEVLAKHVVTHAGTLPIVLSGISMYVGRGGGLYWLLGTVLFSYVAALQDAWVLLIEIMR